jgi:hypothetical protein
MKLSKETVTLLKNFSSINQNILFKEGDVLSTISPQKNLMASATITDKMPIQFGIYDTSEFLGALSLFDDPDLDFTEKFVKISEGSSSIKYFAADESVLVVPQKPLKFPASDVDFEFESEMDR